MIKLPFCFTLVHSGCGTDDGAAGIRWGGAEWRVLYALSHYTACKIICRSIDFKQRIQRRGLSQNDTPLFNLLFLFRFNLIYTVSCDLPSDNNNSKFVFFLLCSVYD